MKKIIVLFIICISMNGYAQEVVSKIEDIHEAKSESSLSLQLISTLSGVNYTLFRYKKIENNYNIVVIRSNIDLSNKVYSMFPKNGIKMAFNASIYKLIGTPKLMLVVFDIQNFDIKDMDIDEKLVKDFPGIDKLIKE